MSAAALVLYALLLAGAALLIWRRPLLALELWIVGLALHNALMAALFAAGVHGAPLTAIQAWKEILLAVALVRVARDAVRGRALPFRPLPVDWLALGFALLVLAYAVVPQHVLGGAAGPKTVLYGLRHDLVPVAAYLLGRSLVADGAALRRLGWLVVATAGLVAAVGILDDYLVPIAWWRDSAVPQYFHEQLGFVYHGTGNADPTLTLPENFVFNLGTDSHFLRRLVSVFLSPLAASYTVLVGMLLLAAGLVRSRRLAWATGLLAYVALLLTYTRSALLVLPVALLLLAFLQRRTRLVALAAVALVVALGWSRAYPHVAPTGHWTRADLVRQHALAARAHTSGSATGAASCGGESSFCSHWHSLKGGVRTVLDHPQGFGLGNAGVTAARNRVALKAGESTYTEVGVETGLVGALLWAAWGVALLAALVAAARRGGEPRWLAAGAAASLAAVLALALQTDVVGDPWLAYVLWALAGIALTRAQGATVQA